MRQIVRVQTPSGADYPVWLGYGAAALLERVWRADWRQAALIGDSNTSPLFAAPIAGWLAGRCERVLELSFAAGEAHKTRATKEKLEDALLAAGFDRGCCLIGVGGGIVLDLVGYVAATLLRGVAHVNVATSLLAQVDAAVGGKTGVNTPHGKNLIGAFHQPRAVLIDVGALASLPAHELRCGLAEAVKHAVLADAELFAQLESWSGSRAAAAAVSPAELVPPVEVVARCVQIKAEVVMRDERESDYRQVLNFGHTVAHALEAASGHQVSHGEAVAMGMVVEGRLAERLCGFPRGDGERLVALLDRLGLPSRPVLPFAEGAALLRRDKKTRGGVVHCALPTRIGAMHAAAGRWALPVELGLLEQAWNGARQVDSAVKPVG